MSVKIYDTMTTATPNFPLAYAEKINIVKEDGSEADIQTLYNNGELSGGDNSQTLTESQYLALPEEERLNNSYYLYDIGVHYKNGVAYSRKKPIQLTMEEYKALKEAGAIDEQQEYLIEADAEGMLLGAEDIGYNNAESGIQATTVQGAIDKVNGKLGELINDAKVTTTNTFSSDKIKAIANDIRKFTLSKTDYQGVDAYPTECGVYRVVKKIDGMPNDASQYAALIIYGNGYFTHIYHDAVSGRMWIGYTADSVKAPTWQELATMDKVNALHKETTGYITGSLLGSVVKNANLYYQKFGDSRLVINGWVGIDAVPARTPIFTLPNNWEANSNYLLPCYVINSNVACACMIDIAKGTVNSYTPLPATSELRFCGEIYLM